MERKRSTSEENDVTQRVVSKTKGGKDFKVGQYTSGYFFVHFADGGQVPKKLCGRYIRYEDAENSIKSYVASK